MIVLGVVALVLKAVSCGGGEDAMEDEDAVMLSVFGIRACQIFLEIMKARPL